LVSFLLSFLGLSHHIIGAFAADIRRVPAAGADLRKSRAGLDMTRIPFAKPVATPDRARGMLFAEYALPAGFFGLNEP
jgi:hypothetical protein